MVRACGNDRNCHCPDPTGTGFFLVTDFKYCVPSTRSSQPSSLHMHPPRDFLLSALWRVFIATLAILCSVPGASAGNFSRVVIDPGHGGEDRGGRTGKVYEKHLALDTALRLEHYLVASGYRVTMTRKSDTFISLSRRAAIGRVPGPRR